MAGNQRQREKNAYLGKNLKKLREFYNLTGDQLAQALNLGSRGQQSISNWENGYREPSLQDAVNIARYFTISVDALLCQEIKDPSEHKKINQLLISSLDRLSDNEINKLERIFEVFLDLPNNNSNNKP